MSLPQDSSKPVPISFCDRFKPEELALRIAVFYSFGQFSGFVAGFLAFAISYADGVLAGWRWLFVIGWSPVLVSILSS